jgi:MoaA/NifB/PqqE/SkfB family radical SAM enzyme
MGSTARTHTNVNSQPTTVNIDIGSTCNLTCSYCCKQFSSAWTRDIRDNGSYLDTDRFKLTNSDLISINVSQKEHQDSAGFNLLVGELEKFSNLEKIIISGGEPFLYSNFVDLLNYISGTRSVIVYSGLGVNSDRLNTQLKKIQNKKQITIRISGENTHQFYEFNRYSNSYTKFKNNIELLLSHGFNIEFAATLSNLTVFGLVEFLEEFADYKTHYQFCNDPEFLRVSVLDDATKQRVIEQISLSDILIKAKIIDAIEKPCTDQQRRDLSCYLKEFVRRRALSLEIFPKSLLQWLEIQK